MSSLSPLQRAELQRVDASIEEILRGGQTPRRPPSPPQASPPRGPPLPPLFPPVAIVSQEALPLVIIGGVLLVVLLIYFCFGEALTKRVKVSVLDTWATRPGHLVEETVERQEPQPLAEAEEDASARQQQTAKQQQQQQEQRQASQKNTDRQRLLEQIAGMGSVWGADPALAEGAAAIDVDAAVAAVGSLDAALLAAVTHGATTMEVRALLMRGASPNAAFLDRPALALAARKCEPGVTQALLEAGALLDKKDTLGWTPLMHAIDAHCAACSREAILMQLLDAGAAVDVWGHDLRGPLDLMVAKQQQQLSARESSRASHITASKITMLMHQKSGSSGSTNRLPVRESLHGASDPALPAPRSSMVSFHDLEPHCV